MAAVTASAVMSNTANNTAITIPAISPLPAKMHNNSIIVHYNILAMSLRLMLSGLALNYFTSELCACV